MMTADMIVSLALCLMFVSSRGQQSSLEPLQKESCKMYTITASLGSSALLPCISTGLSNVTWAHVSNDGTRDVVKLASNGRVQFLEHRQGRVKAFPNQASLGNFSISIDELKKSDLGSYTCKEGKNCFEVELQEENKGQQSSLEPLQKDSCKMYTITASLGSSALLPCIFVTTGLSNVTWAHVDDNGTRVVVTLASNGRVQFLEHRQGRVKAFPNQASVGNFSISIDELIKSDLGSYTCKEGKNCFEVELQEENKGTLDEARWRLAIYICVGVAASILLVVVTYIICQYWRQRSVI